MKFDQEEMRRLAGRYFAGEIAAEEERELFRFVTSDAACRRQFAAWRLEWEAMPASDPATDRDWHRLRSRIRLQGSARSARPGRFAAVWRAAAAVAVVCATFFGARLYEEEDFRNGLELAATGKLPLERLITGVLRLDEIQKAFESFNGNAEAMKVLIQCSDEVEK